VFSDNKPYLLLLGLHFGAMTTRFFLPTNQRFILELPSYNIFIYYDGLCQPASDYYHPLSCWYWATRLMPWKEVPWLVKLVVCLSSHSLNISTISS